MYGLSNPYLVAWHCITSLHYSPLSFSSPKEWCSVISCLMFLLSWFPCHSGLYLDLMWLGEFITATEMWLIYHCIQEGSSSGWPRDGYMLSGQSLKVLLCVRLHAHRRLHLFVYLQKDTGTTDKIKLHAFEAPAKTVFPQILVGVLSKWSTSKTQLGK